MTGPWRNVPLSQVAKPIARVIDVVPGLTYRTIGVKWWGEGAYERATIDGSMTAARTLSVVRQGDLIINKIWVRNGSTAIASKEVDGCAASGEFPTFELDRRSVCPGWLHWLTKTRRFWAQCDSLSRGTSGKNRIKPDLFLTIQVPLPLLSEQQSVVDRIEDVFSRVKSARECRLEAAAETEQLIAAKEMELWPAESLQGARTLEDVSTFLARGRQSEQGESDHFLIKTQHVQQGFLAPTTLRLAPHVAVKVASEAIVVAGDILIACSAAGCLGRVARYRGDGRIASTDTHVAIVRPDSNVVDPDYLYAYLRGAQGQHQIRSRERGDWQREKVSFRLTELNLSDLKKVPVPVPSKMEQRELLLRLTSVRAEVERLEKVQAETATALGAMMPAVLDRAFRGEL